MLNRTIMHSFGPLLRLRCWRSRRRQRWRSGPARARRASRSPAATPTRRAAMRSSQWPARSMPGSTRQVSRATTRPMSRHDDGATLRTVRWQSRYNFNPRDFWYGGARYENDLFSGFSYQAHDCRPASVASSSTPTSTKFLGQIGVGYKIFETRRFDRSGHAAAGSGRERQLGRPGRRQSSTRTSSPTRRRVYDKFDFEAASDNTFLQNEIGVSGEDDRPDGAGCWPTPCATTPIRPPVSRRPTR